VKLALKALSVNLCKNIFLLSACNTLCREMIPILSKFVSLRDTNEKKFDLVCFHCIVAVVVVVVVVVVVKKAKSSCKR
jgi:hypothetical protein